MTRREVFDVGGRPSIGIDVQSGGVDVRAVGPGRVVVVSIDGVDAEEWDVAQLGDSISVNHPGRRGWRNRPVRVLVEVPAGTEVEVNSASADVALEGELGATRVRTASGDVRTATCARLDVSTASGDMRSLSVATTASCTTASGDVDLGRVGGRLTVNTASGNVRIAEARDEVRIGSASGDVLVDRYEGANIAVKCISGDVTLGLPAGVRVDPDISTLSGRTTLPSAPTESSTSTGGERRVVRVGLRTVSGNITIERVDAG